MALSDSFLPQLFIGQMAIELLKLLYNYLVLERISEVASTGVLAGMAIRASLCK
jgi:hypothetical protein